MRDQLVCLYPDDRCETTTVSSPIVLGEITYPNAQGENETEQLLFAFDAGILAMLLANPCQIVWDFLCFMLIKVEVDKDNAKKNCALLSFQMLMSFIFIFVFFYTIHLSIIVVRTGDSFLVFVTFAITWLIDQVKQVGTLALIHLVVVKRFGFLKVNESEFVQPADREIKRENAIPRLKNCCLKTLEH